MVWQQGQRWRGAWSDKDDDDDDDKEQINVINVLLHKPGSHVVSEGVPPSVGHPRQVHLMCQHRVRKEIGPPARRFQMKTRRPRHRLRGDLTTAQHFITLLGHMLGMVLRLMFVHLLRMIMVGRLLALRHNRLDVLDHRAHHLRNLPYRGQDFSHLEMAIT